MKEFVVTMTITGRASAIVMAKNLDEAKEKAKKCSFEHESDELIEWDYDEIESVKE